MHACAPGLQPLTGGSRGHPARSIDTTTRQCLTVPPVVRVGRPRAARRVASAGTRSAPRLAPRRATGPRWPRRLRGREGTARARGRGRGVAPWRSRGRARCQARAWIASASWDPRRRVRPARDFARPPLEPRAEKLSQKDDCEGARDREDEGHDSIDKHRPGEPGDHRDGGVVPEGVAVGGHSVAGSRTASAPKFAVVGVGIEPPIWSDTHTDS